MTEAPKIKRRQDHTPGSVQPIAVFQALHELPRRTVNIDEAQAWTICFKRGSFVVQGIGNYDVIADGLYVERYAVIWQTFVHE